LFFRSLETRIVVFFAALLAVVQAAAFFLISADNQVIAKQQVAHQLDIGAHVFQRVMDQNSRQLTQAAAVLAADFGFREAISTRDTATIVSALKNHGARIKANVVMLADLDNTLIADTLHPAQQNMQFPFPDLIVNALEFRNASALVVIDDKLYQLVLVPVMAPLPVAWVAMGFAVDDLLARDTGELTSLHVSFLTKRSGQDWKLIASTLPALERESISEKLDEFLKAKDQIMPFTLGLQDYETRTLPLQRQEGVTVVAVLQQSLQTALEPFQRLRSTLLTLALASLLLSVLGSILIGRGLIKPINRLALAARRMRDGDYTQTIDVSQRDEIGELASSFNHMKDAISTREEQILRLAYEDTLTALPNRALFNDRLDQTLKAVERNGLPVTILIMDLDRFKYVNDMLGHQTGDLVLREVANRIRRLLRKSDTVARLGGDEFAILLPEAGIEQAEEIVAKILGALEAPITIDEQPLDVGISIGIATYPDHGRDARTIIGRADVAMYVAKRSNTGYAVYDPSYYRPHQQQLTLLGELRKAVEHNELTLYYQPKLSLHDGRCSHVETLVRWTHPQRGFIPPAEFIPFAEQTGYIRTITRWVIEQAILQCRRWHDNNIDLTVSINISARDLLNAELPDLVASALSSNRVDPKFICIEITESGVMEDPAMALRILKQLSGLGLSLSVDDYGTGYSSLSYIKKLPIQELKIDQSFVKNMVKDRDDATIVRSTIDLGHNMGLKVVAEGVEDQQVWDMLRDLNCDHAQGYFMSRPLSASDLEKWLAAKNSMSDMIAKIAHETGADGGA
jgi:diguanylate cyclase (GGDEF)-like protein